MPTEFLSFIAARHILFLEFVFEVTTPVQKMLSFRTNFSEMENLVITEGAVKFAAITNQKFLVAVKWANLTIWC